MHANVHIWKCRVTPARHIFDGENPIPGAHRMGGHVCICKSLHTQASQPENLGLNTAAAAFNVFSINNLRKTGIEARCYSK